jgi:threonine synthase
MIGGQAAGAAPLVSGRPVADPRTIASAIRIGRPASWESAVAARDESEGLIDAVTDDAILDAQRRLASQEGIFGEPASAAALAVLEKAVRDGVVPPGAHVVCIITGNGLKDPATVMAGLAEPVLVPAEVAAVAATLGL